MLKRIRRTIRQLTQKNEDENHDIEWSDFDLSKNNNEFKESLRPNVFFRKIYKIEDFVNLFIGNDFFEFNSIETSKYI